MSTMATFKVIDIKEGASGTGKRGPWTLYVVKADDGKEYTTFKLNGIKIGATVTVSFESVQRRDGKPQNRIVDESKPADAAHVPNASDIITRLASIEAKVDEIVAYCRNEPS